MIADPAIVVDYDALPQATREPGTAPFYAVRRTGADSGVGFRFAVNGWIYEVTAISPYYPGGGATGVVLTPVNEYSGHADGEPFTAYLVPQED